MKLAFFSTCFILSFTFLYGQEKEEHIFLSKNKSDSFRYSKTDFTQVDTLDKWCYKIIYHPELEKTETRAPLCIVQFNRMSALYDSLAFIKAVKTWGGVNDTLDNYLKENIYFTPNIGFKVYELKDSSYAESRSIFYKSITSNVPPYAGGDIFTSGNYIFVNTDFGVRCSAPFFGTIDYCRPMLNFIFKRLNNTKSVTLEEYLKGLLIKQCE